MLSGLIGVPASDGNTFDNHGNLLSSRDPLGNISSYAYSSQGLPLTMTHAVTSAADFKSPSQFFKPQETIVNSDFPYRPQFSSGEVR